MVKVKINMTGWKMWERGVPDSRLIVLGQAEDRINNDGTHLAQWECECTCDSHTIIRADGRDIRSGHVKSCGCIKRERIIAQNKSWHKINTYSDICTDEYGDYYIGRTTNTDKEFYIDAEDFEKIKKYCWSEDAYHYMVAWDENTQKVIKMHTLLTMYDICDHADRNQLNNRRHNLRPATVGENCRNISVRVDNTSNIIGVSWSEKAQRWRAYLQYERNNMNLGYFMNKHDAIRVRLKAEQKYFGEFAPQRHLFEQYGITQQND